MIPYEPHPILFYIGPVAIRFYSLAYILGFILAYIALKKRFGTKHADDSLLWIVIATIIGGRLGYFLFYSPITFVTDPLEVLKIWHGGMSFHGAILAIILVTWLYCRKHKLSWGTYLDTFAIPGAIALGFGRIANFLNGELVGTVTTVPWCMVFPGFDGCRHPSQLYESFYSFVLAGILYWQSKKKKRAPGFISTLFALGYGIFRFLVTFVRDDPRVLGLSTGQWLCAVMIIVSVWLLSTKYKSEAKKFFS